MKSSRSSARLWFFVHGAFLLALIVSVGVLAYFAMQTHSALCTFKGDVSTRLERTQDYMADLESGKRRPIPGITIGDLARSAQAQQATLASLSDLTCK